MRRSIAVAALAATLGLSAAPALAAHPPVMTAKGIGPITLGATIASLRQAHLIGKVTPGCELASPRGSGARAKGTFTGIVSFDATGRVDAISATAGAQDPKGIAVGATAAQVLQAHPGARYDRAKATDPLPFSTITVGSRRHPRYAFTVDPTTKRVIALDVPGPRACE